MPCKVTRKSLVTPGCVGKRTSKKEENILQNTVLPRLLRCEEYSSSNREETVSQVNQVSGRKRQRDQGEGRREQENEKEREKEGKPAYSVPD